MAKQDGQVSSGIAVLVGGALIGLFGAPAASLRTTIHGVTIPWGVILVVITLGVCVRGASYWMRSKVAGALVTIGWILVTLAYTALSPGGDVILPDITRTYGYLVGGFVVCLLATWLPFVTDTPTRGTLVSVDDVVTGEGHVG
jgi:hypothetical protein